MRSGKRAATLRATVAPQECPKTAARETPRWSISPTASTDRVCQSYPLTACVVWPCPLASAAKSRYLWRKWLATSSYQSAEDASPCMSMTGSPSPPQSRYRTRSSPMVVQCSAGYWRSVGCRNAGSCPPHYMVTALTNLYPIHWSEIGQHGCRRSAAAYSPGASFPADPVLTS